MYMCSSVENIRSPTPVSVYPPYYQYVHAVVVFLGKNARGTNQHPLKCSSLSSCGLQCFHSQPNKTNSCNFNEVKRKGSVNYFQYSTQCTFPFTYLYLFLTFLQTSAAIRSLLYETPMTACQRLVQGTSPMGSPSGHTMQANRYSTSAAVITMLGSCLMCTLNR